MSNIIADSISFENNPEIFSAKVIKVAYFKIEFKDFPSRHWKLFCVILLLGADITISKYSHALHNDVSVNDRPHIQW